VRTKSIDQGHVPVSRVIAPLEPVDGFLMSAERFEHVRDLDRRDVAGIFQAQQIVEDSACIVVPPCQGASAPQRLADLMRRPSERLTRAAVLTTSSLPTLKAYLEGERQFRLGQFDAAVEAFTRAVANDSTFALAYYRLSTAAEWLGDTRLAHSAADRAVQFGQRLPPPDRTLLQALLATRSGHARMGTPVARTRRCGRRPLA
jgi:tetratricopeptide (TPR) repeat protein